MYFRNSWRKLALSMVALAGLSGCGIGNGPRAAERIAILRFEDLSSPNSGSTDWIGRAFSEVISTELTGAGGVRAIGTGQLHALDNALGARPAAVPGISAERDLALAAGATRIGYGQYTVRGGRIEAHLTLEDSRTGRMVRVLQATAPAGHVLEAAGELATSLSGRAVKYPTSSDRALEEYVRVIEAPGPDAAQHLETALSADPDFGPAYRTLAHFSAGRGDRAGALAALDRGLARGGALDPVERARLEVESAALREDAGARRRALEQLAKMQPEDAAVWRALADTAAASHVFSPAVEAYRRVVALEPENIDSWNQLAYAEAFAGHLDRAMEALRRYQALRPADPNVLDSMGDANLIAGRLREAEDYYLQVVRKNPEFLGGGDWIKAAMARLMTGDLAGADSLQQRYADARSAANDPLVNLRRAEWLWLSGRRKAACTEMEACAGRAAAGPSREAAVRAYSEVAIWKRLLGDISGGAEAARRAAQLAPSTGSASLARFLTGPGGSVAEWSARLEQAAPGAADPARDRALAFALLLDREFQPAADILKKLYENGGAPADEGLPVMLAWSLVETGRMEEAAPLLKSNPIPPSDGAFPFVSFYFPRLYYLRAVEAEKAGRNAEARALYKLFVDLSGPDSLVWGEEVKARARM